MEAVFQSFSLIQTAARKPTDSSVEGSAASTSFLCISDKKRLSPFEKAKLLVTDVGIDFRPIQLANVEAAACPAAEDEAFLALAEDMVEKLEAMHILWRLVPLAHAALANRCLVNLAVVLALRNDEQFLSNVAGIQINRGLAPRF